MFLLFRIFILIFSFVLGIRCIAYGIYEIKQNKNIAGGIFFVLFSVAVLIFSNISQWFSR